MGRSSAFPRHGFTSVRLNGTFEQDARMALSSGMNLLLVDRGTEVLETIRSWASGPVVACAGDRLALPDPGRLGTLLISGVDRLGPLDQLRLLDWLDASSRTMQIISTTATSLLPRVQRGEFLEALFYRLNMVCIDLTPGGADGETAASVAELSANGVWFEWPPRL